MQPNNHTRPYLQNDITHPVTLIAFLISLLVGSWIFYGQLAQTKR